MREVRFMYSRAESKIVQKQLQKHLWEINFTFPIDLFSSRLNPLYIMVSNLHQNDKINSINIWLQTEYEKAFISLLKNLYEMMRSLKCVIL